MFDKSILKQRVSIDKWQNCDGPIYVSFSLQTWVDYNYTDLAKYFTPDEVDYIQASTEIASDVVQELKRTLEREWVKKAGVKIIYHDPSNSLMQDDTNKNMLFIFANNILKKYKNTVGQSIHIQKDHSVAFKIILLEQHVVARQSNFCWSNFLHEAGHALIGLHDVSNDEFQNGIDCSMTVMATAQQCPKFQQIKSELQQNTTEHVSILPILDEVMPISITPLDIECAQYYREQCLPSQREINKLVQLPEVTPIQPPVIPTVMATESHDRNYLKQPSPSYNFFKTPTSPLMEQFSVYAKHFGSSFVQSFFNAFIDGYIQPYLLSADYDKSFIRNLCNGLKIALNAVVYGSSYAIFSRLLERIFLKTMKQFGCNENQIAKAQYYFSPLFAIVVSFNDVLILDKFLLQIATTSLGNQAGYKLARRLISEMPKIKSEDLPVYQRMQ